MVGTLVSAELFDVHSDLWNKKSWLQYQVVGDCPTVDGNKHKCTFLKMIKINFYELANMPVSWMETQLGQLEGQDLFIWCVPLTQSVDSFSLILNVTLLVISGFYSSLPAYFRHVHEHLAYINVNLCVPIHCALQIKNRHPANQGKNSDQLWNQNGRSSGQWNAHGEMWKIFSPYHHYFHLYRVLIHPPLADRICYSDSQNKNACLFIQIFLRG